MLSRRSGNGERQRAAPLIPFALSASLSSGRPVLRIKSKITNCVGLRCRAAAGTKFSRGTVGCSAVGRCGTRATNSNVKD